MINTIQNLNIYNNFSFFILSIFLLTACSSAEKETVHENKPINTGEWQDLFNGENLEGWNRIGSAEAIIDSGVIVLRRNADEGGWLISDAKPVNFELKAEFQLKTGSNSGIAVRVPALPTGQILDPTSSGYEINLDNRSDIQNPTGTIDFLARAFWNPSIDLKGWNDVYILAEGDHLLVKINGEKVVESFSRRSQQGAIALQAPWGEEGEVRFRNIALKELPAAPLSKPQIRDYMRTTYKAKNEVIFNGRDLKGWHTMNNASWAVIDESITADSRASEGGYLCTDSTYKNFYLSLKFKIAYEDNSGVFIRKNPEADEMSLEVALEVNVYEAPGLEWPHPTGSINSHARAFAGLVDYDDWNIMEVFAFNEQVTVYVNGVKASEGLVPEAFQDAGNICLQVYPKVATDGSPSKVMFKNIMIKNFDNIPYIGY